MAENVPYFRGVAQLLKQVVYVRDGCTRVFANRAAIGVNQPAHWIRESALQLEEPFSKCPLNLGLVIRACGAKRENGFCESLLQEAERRYYPTKLLPERADVAMSWECVG